MKLPAQILLSFFACLFYGAGCDEKSKSEDPGLRKLYEEYKFGQIEKCRYGTRTVYHAGINAFDAGTQVYDSAGRSIGTCNYMSRLVDSICTKLSECEVIYRCQGHISGEPPVNNLGPADSTGAK